MRVQLKNDTEEFKLFMDFWNIMQEVWGIEDTKEYADNAIKVMDTFLERHKTPFAEELIRCLLNELNRKNQTRGKENEQRT